jgi:chemotaxis methyl-accepting protein methylase
MIYTYSLPDSVSFTAKGLVGYNFGPLKQKDLEIFYVESEKGHDFFMISRKITRTYYILSGSGYFTIANERYDVHAGMLVEVPPKVEYCYSGKMTMIGISKPRWFSGNDTPTKWNPDVVSWGGTLVEERQPWLTRLIKARILGKSPLNAYLRYNQALWRRLPSSFAAFRPIRSYGNFLNALARIQGSRSQAHSTFFLRNRPELELIRRIVDRRPKGDTLRVAVLGCSTGAEAYSVAWRIRSARPDLALVLTGVDMSPQAVAFAKGGAYSLTHPEVACTKVCERMTPVEMEEFFHRNGDVVTVKPWIKEGINWRVGDIAEPEIIDSIGRQDIVVASNFLCHMVRPEAEWCLRNIARLVSGGGYLFVSGIDLDIRTKAACDLGWEPVTELIEEIHEGDPCMTSYWPFDYAGLEPLNKGRPDWKIRYAAAFQLPPNATVSPIQPENQHAVATARP